MIRQGQQLSLSLLLIALLAGCGIAHATAQAERHPASLRSLQWIGEPQAGFRPWQTALARARTGVWVNQYLLTDTTYAQALIHIAQGGIPVRVILAANPYHDAAAVERNGSSSPEHPYKCIGLPGGLTTPMPRTTRSTLWSTRAPRRR